MGDQDQWAMMKAEAASRGDVWRPGRSVLTDMTAGEFVDIRSPEARLRAWTVNPNGRTVRLVDFRGPGRVYPGTGAAFSDDFDRRTL